MELRLREDEGTLEFPVEDWFITEPPVWESRFPRAKNWLAVITVDPHTSGGLLRKWCDRGKGRFRYSITGLLEDDLIEFGADYISHGGNRIPCRWYGEVVRVSESLLHCRPYASLNEMLETLKDREERTQVVGAQWSK